MHVAGLFSPTADRHKSPRSGLDLTDPAHSRQTSQDPIAPDLWTEKCHRNRDTLGFIRQNNPVYHAYIIKHPMVAVMKHAQACNTDSCPQIPEGTIRNEDSLNAKLESIDPTTSVAARMLSAKTTPDICVTLGAAVIKAISVERKDHQIGIRSQIGNPSVVEIIPSRFQIFVRTPKENSTLIWAYATDSVRDLKNNSANQIGYPAGKQHLLTGADGYRTLDP